MQKVESNKEPDKENPLFFWQNEKIGTKGEARMTNEGFILYKGSTIASTLAPSIAEQREKLISKLLAENIVVKENALYKFAQDYSFNSPSAAADLVCGYSTNGWMAWKTVDGKTLDEVYRREK